MKNFSDIMARTNYILMKQWCPLYTRPTPWVGFYSACLLKQQCAGRHVAPHWNYYFDS
jgi:hypothetical protein